MIDKNSTKEQVLEAVKQNERALFYASEALRNDREVVMAAVKNSELALEDASEDLKFEALRYVGLSVWNRS